MRYFWAGCLLILSRPLAAEPLTNGAAERMLAPEDHGRLMRMMYAYVRAHPSENSGLFAEQAALLRELQAELFSASPDLERVERLDLRAKALKRQMADGLDRVTEGFYRSLSAEDRLNYMKMTYPLPPRIHSPEKTGGAGDK